MKICTATNAALLAGFALLLASSASCNKDSDAAKDTPPDKTPAAAATAHDQAAHKDGDKHAAPSADEHGHTAPAADEHAHAAAGHGASGEPTLKELMTQLGVDMASINNAIWREDFVTVSKHAKAIADHPHASLEERQRIMKTLGKDFGEFVKGDRTVHGTAVRLGKAADESKMDAVLDELSTLQKGCVSCHVGFRKRLTIP